MAMHERVRAHWERIGKDEKIRRRVAMKSADNKELDALRELRDCQRLRKSGIYEQEEVDRAQEYLNKCAADAEAAAKEYYGE